MNWTELTRLHALSGHARYCRDFIGCGETRTGQLVLGVRVQNWRSFQFVLLTGVYLSVCLDVAWRAANRRAARPTTTASTTTTVTTNTTTSAASTSGDAVLPRRQLTTTLYV